MTDTDSISSFQNPRFKYLKSLSKSRTRKKEGVFLIEGRPEVDLLIKSGKRVKQVVYCEAYISIDDLKSIAGKQEYLQLSKPLFDELSYQNIPGNFLLLAEVWQGRVEDIKAEETLVVLEGLEKPGNLGAILRTCDSVGIKSILLTETEIDFFNPNVLRNSRGGFISINAVFCTNSEALEAINKHALTSYATIISDQSTHYKVLDRDAKTAIIFGAESKGLGEFWARNADNHISIPMLGVVDSLNLSVSVGMILSHVKHSK